MSQEADREFIRNFILVLAALAVSGLIFAIVGVRLADAQHGPQADEQLRSKLSAALSQPVSQVSTVSKSGLVAAAAVGAAGASDVPSGPQLIAQMGSGYHSDEAMRASLAAQHVNNKA